MRLCRRVCKSSLLTLLIIYFCVLVEEKAAKHVLVLFINVAVLITTCRFLESVMSLIAFFPLEGVFKLFSQSRQIFKATKNRNKIYMAGVIDPSL